VIPRTRDTIKKPGTSWPQEIAAWALGPEEIAKAPRQRQGHPGPTGWTPAKGASAIAWGVEIAPASDSEAMIAGARKAPHTHK